MRGRRIRKERARTAPPRSAPVNSRRVPRGGGAGRATDRARAVRVRFAHRPPPSVDLDLAASPALFALCAAAAGAFAWWSYRRSVPRPVGWRFPVLVGLRSAAFALVLFLLFEPVWTRVVSRGEAPLVAVLVDASQSITLGGPALEARVRAAARSLPRDAVDPAVRVLGRRPTVLAGQPRLHGRADGPRGGPRTGRRGLCRAQPPRRRADLGRPLDRGPRPGGRRRALARADLHGRRRRQRLGPRRPPRARGDERRGDGRDARSRSRRASGRRASAGGRRPSPSPRAAEASAWRPSPCRPTAARRPPTSTVTPTAPGLRTYTVTAAPLPGEATTANNSLTVTVRVQSDKRRVLVIAAAPSPDLTALRATLDADRGVETTVRTQRAPGTFYEGPLPDLAASTCSSSPASPATPPRRPTCSASARPPAAACPSCSSSAGRRASPASAALVGRAAGRARGAARRLRGRADRQCNNGPPGPERPRRPGRTPRQPPPARRLADALGAPARRPDAPPRRGLGRAAPRRPPDEHGPQRRAPRGRHVALAHAAGRPRGPRAALPGPHQPPRPLDDGRARPPARPREGRPGAVRRARAGHVHRAGLHRGARPDSGRRRADHGPRPVRRGRRDARARQRPLRRRRRRAARRARTRSRPRRRAAAQPSGRTAARSASGASRPNCASPAPTPR